MSFPARLSLFACLVVFVVGCAKRPTAKEPGRHYDEDGGFSYVLPADWKFVVSPLTKYRIGMAPPQNNFASNVVVIREAGFPSLAGYVKSNDETAAKLLPNMKEIERGPFKTESGLEGVRVLFTNVVDGIHLRQTVFYFVEPKRQYAVTCTAKIEGGDALDEVFSKIVASFRIEPL